MERIDEFPDNSVRAPRKKAAPKAVAIPDEVVDAMLTTHNVQPDMFASTPETVSTDLAQVDPPATDVEPTAGPVRKPLTAAERKRLAALETKISRNLGAFIEVGQSLQEIRDGRLYRDSHSAFADYCADKFGLARRTIDQTIQDAATAAKVSEISPTFHVANEGQAHALGLVLKAARGDDGQKAAVVREVIGAVEASGDRVTADLIKRTAAMMGHLPHSKSGKVGGKRKAATIKTALGPLFTLRATDATPEELRDLQVELVKAARHLERLLDRDVAA